MTVEEQKQRRREQAAAKLLADPEGVRAHRKSLSKSRYRQNPEKYLAKQRDYYRRNVEMVRAKARAYYAKNKEHQRAVHRAWVKANREKLQASNRKRGLRKNYGLTQAEYDAMLMAQGRRCAICGTDRHGGQSKNFPVDHDHATGAVRGLLCYLCNTGLGAFKDEPELLEKAAEYLRASRSAREVA